MERVMDWIEAGIVLLVVISVLLNMFIGNPQEQLEKAEAVLKQIKQRLHDDWQKVANRVTSTENEDGGV